MFRAGRGADDRRFANGSGKGGDVFSRHYFPFRIESPGTAT
jgi:hypothetical protein